MDAVLYTQIKTKNVLCSSCYCRSRFAGGYSSFSDKAKIYCKHQAERKSESIRLAAFTSGRSTFWTYDILTMIKNNPIRILFGNGVNYLFKINYAHFGNPLWAHNDFIQIFSDYGVLGLLVYLGMFKMLFKKTFREIKYQRWLQ